VEEKASLIRRYAAVDYLLVLDFTRGFADQTAEDFLEKVLMKTLKVRHIVVGYDHRFGLNRTGSADWLAEQAPEHGFKVSTLGPIKNETLPVSSTLIRDHIQSDRLDLANAMLGHPYTVFGKVISGDGRGKTLNYPTANVQPELDYKLMPNRGVYLVRATVNGHCSFGMANIGVRPTFEDGNRETLEVNLFDWDRQRGDFYDEHVLIEFLQKLREEKRFDSVEELIQQLDSDKQTCLAIIDNFREL
jgi:riboflavin kinase/FMN adenylyltransferase